MALTKSERADVPKPYQEKKKKTERKYVIDIGEN